MVYVYGAKTEHSIIKLMSHHLKWQEAIMSLTKGISSIQGTFSKFLHKAFRTLFIGNFLVLLSGSLIR